MNLKKITLASFFLVFSTLILGQTISWKTQANKESAPVNTILAYKWWNLLLYAIDITPDYNRKFINGTNSITFSALKTGRVMQIDLQEPMVISNIIWNNLSVAFKKEGNAYIITFPKDIIKDKTETITVFFEGHPRAALKPPFDNGWIWATDRKGRPWMSVACEGSGASIWLPCKEVLYDEPDRGTVFSLTVPDTLTAISNGRLQQQRNNNNGTSTYTWSVKNPINNYNIIPYIGKYVTWHENYPGIKGKLDCDYWVLDYNLNKAQRHLQQTDTMLHCFEYWLGPYPFYEDSYKLVEAPMPGMEHQSAIAYGNGFENGYVKGNLSGTQWGLKWDFILVHESGHEWFGNSITASNNGESWIHEGFAKYLEVLYTDYVFGKEAGNEYALGIRKRIKHDQPVIGTGTSDQYYKSSAMLHIIRQIIGDTAFRGWLQGLNQMFYHRTVTTEQILTFLNKYTKNNFAKVFDQYLRTTNVPVLEYFLQTDGLQYRWNNCLNDFTMPVRISLDSKVYNLIYPTTQWQKLTVSTMKQIKFTVDKNFYIEAKETATE
jgi:aminopeptidase N